MAHGIRTTSMSNPVSAVQEFFQSFKIPPSRIAYETTQYCTDLPQPEQRFVCSVQTPRVVLDDGGIVREVLSSEVFQGEGKRKADAKKDAAANALAYLQQQPLYRLQVQQQQPLDEVLDACISNQVIRRVAN